MTNILLVSVAQFKASQHIDFDDDDDVIELYLLAASTAVIRYLKGNASRYLSIDSPPNSPPDDLDDVPSDISVAVTMLAAVWYRSPDNDTEEAFENAALPMAVRALLHSYRDPALA